MNPFAAAAAVTALCLSGCGDSSPSRGERSGAAPAPSRAASADPIRIVGSSTVFPFSTSVAEQFGAKTEFPTPVVEQTGTGGGMQEFCRGVGAGTPDITNASRRMKASEWRLCRDNGVTDIVEVKIGFDGIVVANTKEVPNFNLTLRQIFEAAAAQLPTSDEDCDLIDNPNRTWSDIDGSLPAFAIEIFGPPPTSGTRDAFVELAMEGGAREIACLAALHDADADGFSAVAHRVREDGAWIDSGENDNSIVQTLVKTPTAVGVFGYSFLEQNRDRIKGANVDSAEPAFDVIASGVYPISRSLYFYMKKQHFGVVPGLEDFAAEFTSEDAWGPFGYLAEKGLISLPDAERDEVAARVAAGETMNGDGF